MSLILAVDIGTGSCRGALYGAALNRLGVAAVEYPTRYPRPGWAEQDPEDILSAVLQAISGAISDSGRSPDEITALTLDGPLHTCLGLTAQQRPSTPVLTWADSRSHRIAEAHRQTGADGEIYERTGCPLHPMYPSVKIAWWRKQHPALFADIKHFVSVKAYVLFRLTGELLEDRATASGSGLLDVSALRWDDRALQLAGIDPDRLPALVEPSHVVEHLDPQTAARTGLPVSTPVVVGSSDAAMSSLGSGTIDLDQMTVMVGTSGAVRRLVNTPLLDPQRRTFCYYFADGIWFAGGAINNGGNTLRWFSDNFGQQARREAARTGESVYTILCNSAEAVSPGSDGLIFLPFLAGERSPHWSSSMRGSLIGITLHHRHQHVVRALLEGVCYRIHSVAQPLEQLLGPSKEVRATGGFARSAVWLQILADVMGRELLVTGEPEGSILGATVLALRTLGMIDSFQCLVEKNPVRRTFRPRAEAHQYYTSAFQRYMRLYWKLRPEF